MRSYLIPCYNPLLIRTVSPYYHRIRLNNMTHQRQESTQKSHITAASNVDKMQNIVHSDSNNGNKTCHVLQMVTKLAMYCRWLGQVLGRRVDALGIGDLGKPTPALLHLHNTSALPKGRALVPGCGSGYDVVAIACPERHVVGVDISDNAIIKATELSSASPNAEHFTFLKADFFSWHPVELFDLIFDYTFFCAIEPLIRSAWARKINDLLKPDGELITLMYPIDEHEGGPPYKVSIANYQEVLHPVGFKATSILENELAIAPRMGREKIGRWKRCDSQSSL